MNTHHSSIECKKATATDVQLLQSQAHQHQLANLTSQNTVTQSECQGTTGQTQTDDRPYCMHCSLQTAQSGGIAAKVGTQAAFPPQCQLTLGPETWTVVTQDDPRFHVASAPIGPDFTEVLVITIPIDLQCHFPTTQAPTHYHHQAK